MDRGAVSDALSWWGIIWSARPARFPPRVAHRHRAARARHGEFGDFADPQQRQPELQVGGVAYRCHIEFVTRSPGLSPARSAADCGSTWRTTAPGGRTLFGRWFPSFALRIRSRVLRRLPGRALGFL